MDGGPSRDLKAPDFKFAANEDKNAIELDGPMPYLDTLRDIIRFFDVKPKTVSVQLRCESVEDGLTFSSEATIENDTTWNCKWDAMQESTSIKARVNDDGTITLNIDYDYKGATGSLVTRIKNHSDSKIDLGLGRFKGFTFSVRAKIVE